MTVTFVSPYLSLLCVGTYWRHAFINTIINTTIEVFEEPITEYQTENTAYKHIISFNMPLSLKCQWHFKVLMSTKSVIKTL
jgi:hypothetical protein